MNRQNLPSDTTLTKLHVSYLLGALLFISFLIKLGYVYFYTDYTHYLFSDMGEYWTRALHSIEHGDHEHGQWAVWPPFAHMTLAWFLKLLSFLDLGSHKLSIVVFTNVLLSTLSVMWFYLIAYKLYPSQKYALIASTLYAFFFPLIYLNAFVLSEHLSLCVLLLSIVLLLYANGSWMNYLMAGVVLAFAIAMRPSFGVIGLPFFIYIIIEHRASPWRAAKYAMLFSTGYVLFLLFVVVNNYDNSDGKVTLSANGGLTFYLSACQKQGILTRYNGYSWIFYPPVAVGRPEQGFTNETVPFYEQKHYYEKGKACLKEHKTPLIERLQRFKYLYQDSMFPITHSAKFADTGLRLFSTIALYLSLLLLFTPLLLFDKLISRSTLFLLYGVLFAQLLVLFFFNVEQRYLYGFFFVIALLSIVTLYSLWKQIHALHFALRLLIWMVILITGISLWQYRLQLQAMIPKKISMHIYQNIEPIKRIDQNRHTKEDISTHINTIDFKSARSLIHEDLGAYPFDHDIFIDLNVSMEVLQEGNYDLIVVSDDGFTLKIDDKKVLSFPTDRAVKMNRRQIHLQAGVHSYALSYFQGTGDMAIRAYYEIDGKRFFIGEDSDHIHFHGF